MMIKKEFSPLRVLVVMTAVILPVVLLAKGIYGSFLFTFSLPVIWQTWKGQRPFHLFMAREPALAWPMIFGIFSGLFLGVSGGIIAGKLGLNGLSFGDLDALKLSLGPWNVSFSLRGELGYRLLSGSLSPQGFISYLLFSVFLIGLGEEVFWRGFIQGKLGRCLPGDWDIFASSLIFAMAHFYLFTILSVLPGLMFLSLIAVSGMVWGWMFKRFGSVWPSAVSHGVAAFVMWKYFFFTP